MLTRDDIIKGLEDHNIVIVPFEKDNLGQNSYDVNIGNFYWELKPPISGWCLNAINVAASSKTDKRAEIQILKKIGKYLGYNGLNKNFTIDPYNNDSSLTWRLRSSSRFMNCHDKKILSRLLSTISYQNHIKNESKIIIVNEGDHLLCYTIQFIGTTNNICATMGSRSSTRRIGLDTCRDAGKGDIGYYNRWAIEVSNTVSNSSIMLVTGNRYSQMTFFNCMSPIPTDTTYGNDDHGIGSGKYQKNTFLHSSTTNIEAKVKDLATSWNIFNLLPKKKLDMPMDTSFNKPQNNYKLHQKEVDCDENELITLAYFLTQFLMVPSNTQEHKLNTQQSEKKDEPTINTEKSDNHNKWTITKIFNYARTIIHKENDDTQHGKSEKITDVENNQDRYKLKQKPSSDIMLERQFNFNDYRYITNKCLIKIGTKSIKFFDNNPSYLNETLFNQNATKTDQIENCLDIFTEFCYLCTISLYDELNFSIYDIKKKCAVGSSEYTFSTSLDEDQNNINLSDQSELSSNFNKNGEFLEFPTEGSTDKDTIIEIQNIRYYTNKNTFVFKSTSEYHVLMGRSPRAIFNIDNQKIYTDDSLQKKNEDEFNTDYEDSKEAEAESEESDT